MVEGSAGHTDNQERFHLRDGFYFARDGDSIVISHDGDTIRVPLNEWASAVAHTFVGGENAETYQAAAYHLGIREPDRG